MDTLVGVNQSFSNALAYDTPLLPADPAQALRSGHTADVPVLSGGNRREQAAFVAGAEQAAPGTYSTQTYPGLVAAAFPTDTPQVLARYPLQDGTSAADTFAALITDASWACPTLAADTAMTQHGRTVYSYEFAPTDTPDVNGPPPADVTTQAAHATDLPYLFDLAGRTLLTTPQQTQLATAMIAYWSAFARTGNPAVNGAPDWPALTGTGGPTLGLADTIAPIDLAAEHHCDFWNR